MRELLWSTIYLMLTLLLIFSAITLTLRITTANLDDLESSINELLADSKIHLTGVRGEWRYLNPVVHVDKVTFENGVARNVELEYDTLESLYRNRLIVRKLVVQRIELHVDDAFRNWNPSELDSAVTLNQLRDFVWHSDELQLSGHINIGTHGSSDRFHFQFKKREYGDSHRISAQLIPLSTCKSEQCGVFVEVEGTETNFGVGSTNLRLQANTREFVFRPETLGFDWSPITVEGELIWRNDDVVSWGQSHIQVTTTNRDDKFTWSSHLNLTQQDDSLVARATHNLATQNDESIDIPPARLVYIENSVHVGFEKFDVNDVLMMVGELIGSDRVSGEWLTSLSQQGEIDELALVYDLTTNSIAYSGHWSDYVSNAYKQFPAISVDHIRFSGGNRFIWMVAEDSSLEIGIPLHFSRSWDLTTKNANAYLFFGKEHVGFQGTFTQSRHHDIPVDLRVRYARHTKDKQHVFTLALSAKQSIEKPQLTAFLPNALGDEGMKWLEERIHRATLSDIDVVIFNASDEHSSSIHTDFSISATVSNGHVQFLEDWDPLTEINGYLSIKPNRVDVELEQARIREFDIADGKVRIPFGQDRFSTSFNVRTDLTKALQFVNDSPLSTITGGVSKTWIGEGAVEIGADLTLSRAGDPPRTNDIQVSIALDDANLVLQDWDLAFDDITGSISYLSPFHFTATDVDAQLFDNPARVNIESNTQQTYSSASVEIGVAGEANAAVIASMITGEELDYIEGSTEFQSLLEIRHDSDIPPHFQIFTDLHGIQIDLPQPLGKTKDVRTHVLTNFEFLDDFIFARIESTLLNGWMRFKDGAIATGSLGIGTNELPLDDDHTGLALTGKLTEWELDFAQLSDDGSLEYTFSNLAITKLSTNVIPLNDVILNGSVGPTQLDISFDTNEIKGHVVRDEDDILQVHATQILLPFSSEEEHDPLSPQWIDLIPAVDLRIDNITLVKDNGVLDDFGSWEFKLRPHKEGVQIAELKANLKYLTIELLPDEPVAIWFKESNRTSAAARVYGTDLAEVLPAWEYDTNIESDQFELRGIVEWSGSPLNFNPSILTGEITATAHDGRFVEIRDVGGAIRIASLLNFSEWLNRLQFNFTDVVQEGFVYREIVIDARIEGSMLQFKKPMIINGPGCEFQINGTVNLESGELDNEMIVTIPLHKSLPWYAAYVAFANPLVGIGLFISTQGITDAVFKPFTSGRYEIDGNWDDPNIRFVELFQNTLRDSDTGK